MPDDEAGGFGRLSALAPESALARSLVFLDETGSTMDEARERAASRGAPLLVVADSQGSGRGRSGRSWHGAEGLDLMFTAALAIAPGPHPLPAFTLAVGTVLHEAIEPMLGARAGALTLKWPNDLWVGERKLAGVLCEATGVDAASSASRPGAGAIVLVGVGLNVNSGSFPPDLEPVATSLRLETGRVFERVEVLATVCGGIEGAAAEYSRGGFAVFETRYSERCLLWGRRCTVDGEQGVMRGVDRTGALVLELADGSRRLIASGHVETVR